MRENEPRGGQPGMTAMQAIVVQKYGGSSVADTSRIRKVAERIAATRRQGKAVCVVVSESHRTK